MPSRRSPSPGSPCRARSAGVERGVARGWYPTSDAGSLRGRRVHAGVAHCRVFRFRGGAERRSDDGQARPDPGARHARRLRGARLSAAVDPGGGRRRAPRPRSACRTRSPPRRSPASTSRRPSSSRKELGVEACFVQPTFTEVTAGGWGDRLDIAYALRGDQRDAHGEAVDDPALLLHPAAVPRPAGLALPEAVGPRRQDDRDVHELHGRVVPPGDARRSPASTSSRRSRTPSSPGSRPRAPGIDALAAGEIDAFLTAEPVGARGDQGGQATAAPRRGARSRCTRAASSTRAPACRRRRSSTRSTRSSRPPTRTARSRRCRRQWFGTDYTTPAGQVRPVAARPGGQVIETRIWARRLAAARRVPRRRRRLQRARRRLAGGQRRRPGQGQAGPGPRPRDARPLDRPGVRRRSRSRSTARPARPRRSAPRTS